MNGFSTTALALAGLLSIGVGRAAAEGFAAGRHARTNAAGGVTAGEGRAFRGPEGAAGFQSRRMVTDGAGDAAGGSRGAFHGPNGATGARSTRWSRSADGTFQRSGAAGVSGANGSATTSGSMTRSASGASGQRSSSATASSGATYSGETTYEKGSGVSHSGTCTNLSGQVVACPR